MGKKKAPIEDVLLRPKADRRLLAHVPDPTRQRSGVDRRDNKQSDSHRPQYATFAGQRYHVNLPVKVCVNGKTIAATCTDISQTGMLVSIKKEDMERFQKDQHVKLRFHLEEGILQEGTEKRYRMGATVVRVAEGSGEIALHFDTTLY